MITLPPGDYWRLRYLQERMEHAKTRGLLGELRAVQAHAECFADLMRTYPALAAPVAWAMTDADTSLSAPDTNEPHEPDDLRGTRFGPALGTGARGRLSLG